MTDIFQMLAKLSSDFATLATLQEAYHYTDTHNAKKILQDGKFKLHTPVMGESDKNHVKKPYYLSLTRSKIGHYTKKNSSGTVFNLNTDHIQHHHKLSQVDYWGPDHRKYNPTGNEMEERVHSDKPHMHIPKEATKLIKSIHILHPAQESWQSKEYADKDNEDVRHTLILAKKHKIPVHVYSSKQDWLHQRTNKALSIKDIHLKGTGPKKHMNATSDKYAKKDIHPYVRLYHKSESPKYGNADYEIKRNIHNYPKDAKNSLESTLHNHRKSEHAHKLASLVHKHGGTEGFLKHLADKHPYD